MKYLKLIAKIAGALIVIVGLATYWKLPSWQQRAAHNLDVIHHAIDEMHPAVLEQNATAFHEWHTKGYEQAKAMLPLVKGPADEQALIRFYFAGYEDPHLNGGHTKYFAQSWYARNDRWLGWILKATNSGYKVAYSLSDKDNPPVSSQLLRCDEQEIDGFLKNHFAPYFDRRWNISVAREKAAKSLAVDTEYTSVLHRPDIKQCEFVDSSGVIHSYPVHWRSLTKDQSSKIDSFYWNQYSLPSVRAFAPNSYWVTASDFQLGSKQAYDGQQTLLRDLGKLTDVDLVVIDVRANSGGSSRHGSEIINVLFKENAAYIENQYRLKSPHQDGQYRVSQFTLWSYEALLNERIKAQGNESVDVDSLTRLVNHLRDALKQGKTHILQSEIMEGQKEAETMPKQDWKFKGKVILLTSSRCVSSCLDFVDAIKLIPNLVQVGETTDGDTAYTTVAPMREMYYGEWTDFGSIVKKNFGRLRGDNVPYIPDIPYDGDINDTAALEKWILGILTTH